MDNSSPETESDGEIFVPDGEYTNDSSVPSASSSTPLQAYAVDDLDNRVQDCLRQKVVNPDVASKLCSDIEQFFKSISMNLDVVLRELRGKLRGMSDLTLETSQCFLSSISTACDVADVNIRSAYAMVAKMEEVSQSLQPIGDFHNQVKELKRLVEVFETVFEKSMAN